MSLIETIQACELQRGQQRMWYLGNTCVAVKTSRTLFCTDPFFAAPESNRFQRRYEPLIHPESMTAFDAIFFTHEHGDHCNTVTVRAIYEHSRAQFYGPLPVVHKLIKQIGISADRVFPVATGQLFQTGDVLISVLDSYDPISTGAVTYYFRTPIGTIFHIGDSHMHDIFYKIGRQYPIDIALLNLGKNPPRQKFYMEPAEFHQCAQALSARLTIPIHWDNWTRTYIDPKIISNLFPDLPYQIVQPGEEIIFQ